MLAAMANLTKVVSHTHHALTLHIQRPLLQTTARNVGRGVAVLTSPTTTEVRGTTTQTGGRMLAAMANFTKVVSRVQDRAAGL